MTASDDRGEYGGSKALAAMVSRFATQLPLLANTVVALSRLNPARASDLRALEDLVGLDPMLAVRLLVLTGRPGRPADELVSIPQLVAELGPELLVASIRRSTMIPTLVGAARPVQEIVAHSVQTAIWAERLVAMVAPGELAGKEAYLCGLVHDLGRIIFLCVAPGFSEEVSERGWQEGSALLDAEREVLGMDHSHVGTIAARTWTLPAPVVGAIEGHHCPLGRSPHHGAPRLVEEAVALADRLSFLTIEHPTFAGMLLADRSAHLEACGAITAASTFFPCRERIAELVPTVLAASLTAASKALGLDLGVAGGTPDELDGGITECKIVKRRDAIAV